MNSSYALSLADGFHGQITAGDAGASPIVEMLAHAMKLRPCSSAAGHSLLVLTGQEKELFSLSEHNTICLFSPPQNKDELVFRAMEASLAIAHAAQRRGGVLVHGGLAEYKGKGVILAAPGGTGKSTAASRLPHPWRSLSDDAALIVRDLQGRYFAHPWPTWSQFYENGPGGEWDVDAATPLKTIYFLLQSPRDDLEELMPAQAAAMLITSVEQANRVFDRRLSHPEIEKNHSRQFFIVGAMTVRLPAYRLRLSLTGEFWKLMEGSINPDSSLETTSDCPEQNIIRRGKRSLVDRATPNEIESTQAFQSGVVFSGNSMYPTLKEPDYLEICPYNGATPRRGDVVYFRSPHTGMMVVHRIMALRPEGLSTKGDNNPHRDPCLVPVNDLEGRVVAARRSGREQSVRGGTMGMLYYCYARMSRRARTAAGRLYRLFSRYCQLPAVMRSLASNRVRCTFVLFGKMPLGHMKIFANNRCVGRYLRGAWHIAYPWRLLVDPAKIAAAAEQYETAREQWQLAQRNVMCRH